MRRPHPFAALAIALTLASTWPAGASTSPLVVTLEDFDGMYLEVRTNGRRADDLDIVVGSSQVEVSERRGRTLTAGAGCRRPSRSRVVCVSGDLTDVDVSLGAGNDRLRLRTSYGIGAKLRGGAGDDALRASGTADSELELGGDGGADVLRVAPAGSLYGGPGDDRLYGGSGRDLLSGDGRGSGQWRTRAVRPGDDRLDGGRGQDEVSYGERTQPVRADLRSGAGGSRGERDRIRRVEDLTGGDGADVLRGDARANSLDGRSGADLLVGRDGRDVLDLGEVDGAADAVICGAAVDVVVHQERAVLPRDCERLYTDVVSLRAQPRRLGARRLRFQLYCSSTSLDCRRRVTVSRGGRVLGRSARVELSREFGAATVRLERPLPARAVVRITVAGDDREEDEFGDPAHAESIPYRLVYRLRTR